MFPSRRIGSYAFVQACAAWPGDPGVGCLHVHLGAPSTGGVPNTLQPSRDASTGWRCHSVLGFLLG